MRIAIDMQGALSVGSRPRGIGRYTLNLVHAMARERGADLHLMLNDNFTVAADETEADMKAFVPEIAITRFRVPTCSADYRPATDIRRRLGQDIVRRAFAATGADVMFATSIFEHKASDFYPNRLDEYPATLTVGILYDLIPLVFPDVYLLDKAATATYMESVTALGRADLLLAISESAKRDGVSYANLDPDRIVNISGAADDDFRPLNISVDDRAAVMKRIGLSRDFVMYVAGADWRKNLVGVIKAVASMPQSSRRRLQILLVTNPHVELRVELAAAARETGIGLDNLVIAPNIEDDDLKKLLNLAEALVFPSLYEGFGLPVLEAMQCGTPVIVAKTSSLPEIVNRSDVLFDPERPEQAGRILHRLVTDAAFRADVSRWGIERAKVFSWQATAKRALDAIDQAAERGAPRGLRAARSRLLDLDAARADMSAMLRYTPSEDSYVGSFVSDLLFSVPRFQRGSRRLLVDASVCEQTHAWTGIQRVVRKLTAAFYNGGVSHANVVPVAIRIYPDRIVSAEDHITLSLGEKVTRSPYEIEIRTGDDLFMVDSNWIEFPDFIPLFSSVRKHGGQVFTCVYDLIPELHPEVCGEGMPRAHERWLRAAVAESDGLICISRAVADELLSFIQDHDLPHRPGLKIGWFHCGSDLDDFHSVRPVRDDVRVAFADETPAFLAVGTVEPRKCHALAIEAFDLVWKQGTDARLVFIGGQGWKVDALAERIRAHPEHGRRLFWFEGASDNDVSYAYENAAVVVSMSMAEGFGLPLAEAARLGKGVICSDIPVFREVGGEGAVYFESENATSMAKAVSDWLTGRRMTDPSKVSRTTWMEAARRIGDVIYSNDWYRSLP